MVCTYQTCQNCNSLNMASGSGPESSSNAPSSLLENARRAVVKATGIAKSKDLLPTLNLPKSVVQYLTSEFKTSDFYINRDDVTPEDIDDGTYKAICRLDDTAVILKIVNEGDTVGKKLAILDQWEALRHDGIQKCYASFNEKDTRVYVLEHMLRADEVVRQMRTAKSSLSEKYVWYALNSVCKHLKYCQDNKLVYKDIQPHKIGYLTNGDVILQNGVLSHSDQLVSAMEHMIMADDMPVGVYTPPEVIDEEQTTEKTLTWQVGAVLYELASLRPAYQVVDASDVFSPLGEIMEGKLPPPTAYSDELNKILHRCMSYLQEERPTLAELIAESEEMYDDSVKEVFDLLRIRV